MRLTKQIASMFRSEASNALGAQPFRILIQGMNYAPEFIGVGKYTTELATYLAGRGHRVEAVVATPHYPGFYHRHPRPWRLARSVEAGVRVTRCPLVLRNGGQGIWRLIAPLSFALSAAPVLVWRALRTRPDCILCVEPALAAAPAAVVAARLCGARLVLHAQDLEVDAAVATGHLRGPLPRRAALALERLLLRRFDAVVTIADSMAARLAAKGIEPARISVVRNWLRLDRPHTVETVSAVRAGFGIGPSERVILYAGHLGAKQGIEVLLDAAARLACPDIRVVVAGEGPLAGAVASACLRNARLLLLPLQPPERFADLMAMADVHVLPQQARAADLVFPSKLGPMLATGRPVVVTADAGTELAGWLDGAATVVPAGDPAAMADALMGSLQGDPAVRRERAAALVATLDAATVLPWFEQILLKPSVVGPRERETSPALIGQRTAPSLGTP